MLTVTESEMPATTVSVRPILLSLMAMAMDWAMSATTEERRLPEHGSLARVPRPVRDE